MPEPSPFNSLRGLIKGYYGFDIRQSFKETTLTVGTTAVSAGTQAFQRSAITFGNCGSNLIVVGLSPAVTSSSGFPVPIGGYLTFNWFLDNELVGAQFYAISGTASQTLYICESVISIVN